MANKPNKNGTVLPPGKGRPKGSRNRATTEIKKIAQAHGKEGIDQLVLLVAHGKPHATRVAVAKELLDRGYGRPAQETTLDVHLRNTPSMTVIFAEDEDKE